MRAFCIALLFGTSLAGMPGAAALAETSPVQVAQADATLKDFAGPWVGSTGQNAEIVRNATLLIEPKGDTFSITWTNFEAETDPGAPPVTERKRMMRFEPSKQPGVWRATGAGDPVQGYSAWAHITGRTLRVHIVAVLPDGRLEHQLYDRERVGDTIKLSYSRLLDGKQAKSIEATFLKL